MSFRDLFFCFLFFVSVSAVPALRKTVHRDERGVNYFASALPRVPADAEIEIENLEVAGKEKTAKALIVASTAEMPNGDRDKHFVCEENICRIPHRFLKKSENGKLNLVVYCKECSYDIKITYYPPDPSFSSFRQLQEVPPRQLGIGESDVERLNKFAGNGLGALFVLFVVVFVVVAAVNAIRNIYVHSSSLVEQPLKLGKIDG